PLLAKVQWLRLGEKCRSRRVREANRGGYRPGRQQLQQVLRLQRLSGASHMANQVCNRAARCLQERARQLRQLNEANLMASPGCNRVTRCRLEQARRLRRLSEANLTAGRRRSRAALCRLTLAVARRRRRRCPRIHPTCIDKARNRLVARLRVKRADTKGGKRLTVSLADHHKEVEDPPPAGHHKEVVDPLQPNAAKSSHNTERKREKKNHNRRDHNNSGAICKSGSGKKIPEPLFVVAAFVSNAGRFVSGRLTQAPVQQTK